MLKGNFNMKAFIKARVAQSVEHQVGNLEVVVSSPTLCKHFFLFLFLLSTHSWQIDLFHTNEIMHDIYPR